MSKVKPKYVQQKNKIMNNTQVKNLKSDTSKTHKERSKFYNSKHFGLDTSKRVFVPTPPKQKKVTWRKLWNMHQRFPWPFKPIPFAIVFIFVGLGKLGFETMHGLYTLYNKIFNK